MENNGRKKFWCVFGQKRFTLIPNALFTIHRDLLLIPLLVPFAANLSAELGIFDQEMNAGGNEDKYMNDMSQAHKKQLEVLQMAIAEERDEDSRVGNICLSTLRTKYDHFLGALVQKTKLENDSYMERALSHLETSVRLESEQFRRNFETQQSIEEATARKLEGIITNLRQSWKDEELSRAKRLEDRLRGHYSVILEHMEAQLQMALQLQDEVDKQWVKDVEMRNHQQMKMMNAFEKKCRRLYDGRLTEYIERSDEQMTEYTTQLLQVGGTIAQERSRVESHNRRLKLACHQWKVEYQNDIDKKYQKTLASIEDKYIDKIKILLDEKARYGISSGVEQNLPNNKIMVDHLKEQFGTLNVSAENQVLVLCSLLEASSNNTQVTSMYDFVKQKLASRGAIAKKIERKNYLTYKMKLTNTQGKVGMMTQAQKQESHDISRELSDIQLQIEELTAAYASYYDEEY